MTPSRPRTGKCALTQYSFSTVGSVSCPTSSKLLTTNGKWTSLLHPDSQKIHFLTLDTYTMKLFYLLVAALLPAFSFATTQFSANLNGGQNGCKTSNALGNGT
jgi:hypothetical protein